MTFLSRTARPLTALRALAALGAATLLGPVQAADCPAPAPRPSPDWRDQVVYFVMTDRFDDGNPGNNDQGAGEFNPKDNRFFSGGDFQGLMRRLDYIQGLGATTLWITPPVRNQWWDGGSAGYHGYWASHLKEVDPHLGTLGDYRCLAGALHARGMHLIQDVVPNHMGNYFSYTPGAWRRDRPAAGWQPNLGSLPEARPRQAPFDQNDARDPAQAAANIYHWTPNIENYADPEQEHGWQMSGLDDLNTENPVVRRALRDSYAFWLREVGVDALRVDTAFYIPPSFFEDWLHSQDPSAPGLARVARQMGRQDLLVFGEAFGIDKPFQSAQMRRIQAYQTPGRMNGMLNFPLYGSLQAVFAQGRPTAELAHRVQALAQVFGARQHRMPTFIDNHDVDRFLAGGTPEALDQSLLALFTLPGIPTIYYGTEQGFTEPRAAMFAAGYGSGGRDRFDTASPTYRLLARLAALRQEERAFSRGTPTLLRASAAGPGVLAWRTEHEGRRLLVVFNTSPQPQWVDRLPVHRGAAALRPRFALHGQPSPLHTDAQGQLNLVLPPRSGQVWVIEPSATARPSGNPTPALASLAPPPPAAGGTLRLRGRVPAGHEAELVADGDLAHALPLAPDANGHWEAAWPTDNWLDPTVTHRLSLRHRADADSPWLAALPREVKVSPAWRTWARVSDPLGDDHGPGGHYLYPTDPSWGPARQMDLRGLQVEVTGQALRLTVQTRQLTNSWNPANGFDHVAFTLFLELPGQDGGIQAMPLQGGELPEGMRWHRRLRVHGWSNALFSADGAGPESEGRPHTPGATLETRPDQNALVITLPAAALPPGTALDGARLYLSTWDWDGGYRELAEQPGTHTPGGRRSAQDPRWMDAIGPITLRKP
jgi:glycosidase